MNESDKYKSINTLNFNTNPADLTYIINDPISLSKFTSEQASWVGFYYGKFYCGLVENQEQGSYQGPSLTFHDNNKYVVTMITRQHEVVFYDKGSMQVYTMAPIEIMMASTIICEFDPADACYIGILSAFCENRLNRRKNYALTELKQS